MLCGMTLTLRCVRYKLGGVAAAPCGSLAALRVCGKVVDGADDCAPQGLGGVQVALMGTRLCMRDQALEALCASEPTA